MAKFLHHFLPPVFRNGTPPEIDFLRSAISGFLFLILLVFGIGSYHIETGLPKLVMMAFGMMSGFVLFIIFIWLAHLTLYVLRKIPILFIYLILGTLLALLIAPEVGFRWPIQIYMLAIIFAIAFIFIIMKSYYFLKSANTSNSLYKTIARTGIALPILLMFGFVYWLYQDGNDPFAKNLPSQFLNTKVTTLSSLGIENPSLHGGYKFQTFTYGSGTDKKRKEFSTGIKFKTSAVDASRLLPEWKDKKKKWREKYWGFGVKNFPLNGRVYMPEGKGAFPLILIVHGNHSMIDYSDGGYAYLGELLASRGFVVASIDENFVNAHWSGDFRGKEMPARAWLLLKHLEQWNAWNNTPGHELANKIDMDQIMLVGHSRGGEAVTIAAAYNKLAYFPDDAREKFDFNFNIKGIVPIAPTDYRYHRQIKLKNINYLSLQGSNDSDETSFWGMRPYHRLKFTDKNKWLKAGVYIHRANHGQFNSTWGRADMGAPFKWLLNTKPLVTGEDQREAAKIFISAFAEAVLKEKKTYLPLFKNAGAAKDWLPENYYLTHFKNSNSKILVNFEEDIDPATGLNKIQINSTNLKLWREENLSTRDKKSQQNNVVFLGWDYGVEINSDSIATYNIVLPDSMFMKTDSATHFLISIAAGDFKELEKGKKKDKIKKTKKREEPKLDFTVKFTDINGQFIETTICEIKNIAPQLKVRFTKLKSLDQDMFGDEWEVHLEDFFVPLENLEKPNQAFQISELKKIQLIFDRCPYGVVVIDEIGLQFQ